MSASCICSAWQEHAFFLCSSLSSPVILHVMKTIVLEGPWTLRCLDEDILRADCPDLCGKSVEVTLPFDVHSALHEAGFIEDPYKGENALTSRFISRCRWSLTTGVALSKKQTDTCTLVLSSVDTFASLVVNGRTVGRMSNAFARHMFDITGALHDGENTIEIVFDSLEDELDRRQSHSPRVPRQALVRKCARHFGPYSITPVGIYEPVRLVMDDTLIVHSWNCIPRLVDHNWIMKVEITAKVFRECDVDFAVTVAGRHECTTTHVSPMLGCYSFTFTIPEEDVARWNPVGLGGQHLYPMDISFASHSDKRMIAFRTVRLENEPDEGGRSFRLFINDRPVFVKGVIWTGLDLLASTISPTRCIRALQSAVQVGFNAVRVHCSSAYESEVFHDSCDRLGLMVWQDFMFDEAGYPQTEEFRTEVEQELEYQILRLKSHPSIVLMCGGGSPSLPGLTMREAVEYDRLNNGLIETAMKRYAPSLAYVPHSGVEDISSTVREHPEASYGLSYSQDNSTLEILERDDEVPRFVSSFSFPSIPSLATVRRYCEEGELNIATDSMMKHQSMHGAFSLIVSSILVHYRFPDSLEKMIYLSQLVQAETISSMVDRYRSHGARCMGLFMKSLVSGYPAADESAIEHSGKWKMLMYQMRNIYAPVTTLCLRKDGHVTVMALNDGNEEQEVKVSLKFSSFHGDKLKMQVFRKVLPPRSLTAICRTEYSSFIRNPAEAFAYVKLSTPDIYREDLVLLEEPKRCRFVDPQLKVDVVKTGRNFTCTVSCTYPAFQVYLDAGDLRGTFSENLFSIRPTAQKTVSFICDDDISLDDFRKALKTYDLYWASIPTR